MTYQILWNYLCRNLYVEVKLNYVLWQKYCKSSNKGACMSMLCSNYLTNHWNGTNYQYLPVKNMNTPWLGLAEKVELDLLWEISHITYQHLRYVSYRTNEEKTAKKVNVLIWLHLFVLVRLAHGVWRKSLDCDFLMEKIENIQQAMSKCIIANLVVQEPRNQKPKPTPQILNQT